MILEALTHLMTPAPRYVKKMGYLKEAIAIEARVKRCQSAWQPHLDQCKSLIINEAKKLPVGSQVMILGSGGFHDVPIRRLLALKHQITCIDIIHLPKTKKRFPEVTFKERDITGLNENIFDAIRNGTAFKPAGQWYLSQKPDLIISLNLLSQLPIKMNEYAETHNYKLEDAFKEKVIKDHITWLKKQDTAVLMISDISRNYLENEILLETVASLSDLGLPDPFETWVWDIAPKGEADRDINITHNVGSWKL